MSEKWRNKPQHFVWGRCLHIMLRREQNVCDNGLPGLRVTRQQCSVCVSLQQRLIPVACCSRFRRWSPYANASFVARCSPWRWDLWSPWRSWQETSLSLRPASSPHSTTLGKSRCLCSFQKTRVEGDVKTEPSCDGLTFFLLENNDNLRLSQAEFVWFFRHVRFGDFILRQTWNTFPLNRNVSRYEINDSLIDGESI